MTFVVVKDSTMRAYDFLIIDADYVFFSLVLGANLHILAFQNRFGDLELIFKGRRERMGSKAVEGFG